jgi:hypothetical protein
VRSKLLNKVKSLQQYQGTLEGMIIYVDPTARWCNVNLPNEVTVYRLPFDEGVHPRLRRFGQYVTLTAVPGNRTKYLITGASRRRITDTTFASKGTFNWNDGTKWNDGHVWG